MEIFNKKKEKEKWELQTWIKQKEKTLSSNTGLGNFNMNMIYKNPFWSLILIVSEVPMLADKEGIVPLSSDA